MRPHSLVGLITSNKRPLSLALFGLWAGAVAYLTLTPAAYTPPLTLQTFLCIACGEADSSDIIRNWILFVPGGLLGALVFPAWRAVALPICLTLLVEVVQIGVPGRDPRLQDVLLNALGAVTGVVVMRKGLPPLSQRLLGTMALLAWLAPLLLLVPRTTPSELWGQWTPRFGGSMHYEGHIVDASVSGLRVESGRLGEKPILDASVIRREPVHLLLQVGPQPASWAPVFQIVDGEQQGIVLLGAIGPDLILRGHNPARILKLDQPDVRWPGAMSEVAVGDTVAIVVDRSRGSVCMSVGERERCNLAPSLADGWGHILNLEGPPLWFRTLLSMGWAVGLGGLLGLTARSHQKAMALAILLASVGYVGSIFSPDVRPSLLHTALLVGGALVGTWMRRPVTSLWAKIRPA